MNVRGWKDCPLCQGEAEQVSLGAEQWEICARCGVYYRIGENLWTPPHLSTMSPQDFGASSWDEYYASVLARLSGLRLIDLREYGPA